MAIQGAMNPIRVSILSFYIGLLRYDFEVKISVHKPALIPQTVYEVLETDSDQKTVRI